MKENKSLIASMLILIAAVVVFAGIHHANAVTVTTTSRAMEMKRLRVNFLDLTLAPNVTDPGNICPGLAKRVVLYTVPAAGQVNSIVTKVRTAFAGTLVTQVGVTAVRAEQGGSQISTGDIAVPHTDLTDTTYVENRVPNSGEYAFYDEDASWDVVAYFCGQNALSEYIDLTVLTQGVVDFYAMVTRN